MASTPQPAKKSYFFDKGYKDLGNTIKGAWVRNWESVKNYADNLKDLGDKSAAGKWFFGILNVIAIIAVFVFGSAITAVITVLHIVILLLFMLLVYIGFSCIWLVDRIYLLRNKIFTACHECKEKSLIPTYICPKCGAKHTNLTPGIYGILHRTCNCGEKLPVTFFNGRKELSAECPHCGHALSDRESRPICIPIVGGRSVGKTAFITAFSKEFIENISDDKDNRRLRELNNASLFIASKQKLTILLGGQIEFKKIAAVPAVITVSYNSKYQETTTIDLNQYAFMLVYTSSEEDISQHVKKMQEHNDKFHKQLVSAVETLHSPMLQSVIVHDGGDSYATKFMILKMVSLNPGIQCLTIAESIKAEKEEVLDLLLELRQLDRLVTVRPDEKESDDDYKAHWYRK